MRKRWPVASEVFIWEMHCFGRCGRFQNCSMWTPARDRARCGQASQLETDTSVWAVAVACARKRCGWEKRNVTGLGNKCGKLENTCGRARWEKQMWTVPLGSVVGFDRSTSKMLLQPHFHVFSVVQVGGALKTQTTNTSMSV